MLSEKEKEILKRLCLPTKKIAKQLWLSEATVKSHIYNITLKLGNAKNRTQALFKAIKDGVIKFEEIILED